MKPYFARFSASALHRLVHILVVFVVLVFPTLSFPAPSRAEPMDLPGACHFGITDTRGIVGYDVGTIGVDALLNWQVTRASTLPSHIAHTKVVRVRNDVYLSTRDNLDDWVAAYPGQVWVIGNEPDTSYSYQDGVLPEVYAERYYELANIIRAQDPTAKIGFGPIVQPTPLRMRYMERVMNRLIDNDLAGNIQGELDLIDVFTPHAFLLNEEAGMWGAGIPPGFEDDHADAFVIDINTEITKTHDINTFRQFVRNYRQWMKYWNAQDKPLWITEYGSLLPPMDPPGGPDHHNVSDEDTRDYMLATFDFILTAKSSVLGYAPDDDRLVQRGYWYSLNELRYVFGGSLFDPLTLERTLVGDAFVAYDPPAGSVTPVNPDVYPISATLTPLGFTPGSGSVRMNYQVNVRVGNHVISDLRTEVRVVLKDGGTVLASGSGHLARCGGAGIISLIWNNVIPNISYPLTIEVTVIEPGVSDTNLSNNSLPVLFTPSLIFAPLIAR